MFPIKCIPLPPSIKAIISLDYHDKHTHTHTITKTGMGLYDDVGEYTEMSHGVGGAVGDMHVTSLSIGLQGSNTIQKKDPFIQNEIELRCPLTIFYTIANGDVRCGSIVPVVGLDDDQKFKAQNIPVPGDERDTLLFFFFSFILLLCSCYQFVYYTYKLWPHIYF